jgi:hypothetical protein
MRRYAAIIATAFLLSLAGPSAARSPPLRSDVPLWQGSGNDVWPRRFEGAIGVESPIAVGDWRVTDIPCAFPHPGDCETWLRIRYAGAIHGGFAFQEARTRTALDGAPAEIGFVVPLSEGGEPSGPKLLAFEIGMQGGSRYLLVRASGEPLFKHFDVLPVSCAPAPNGVIQRRAPEHTIFRTDYCVAVTQDGIARLARQTAHEPAEATMDFVADR